MVAIGELALYVKKERDCRRLEGGVAVVVHVLVFEEHAAGVVVMQQPDMCLDNAREGPLHERSKGPGARSPLLADALSGEFAMVAIAMPDVGRVVGSWKVRWGLEATPNDIDAAKPHLSGESADLGIVVTLEASQIDGGARSTQKIK